MDSYEIIKAIRENSFSVSELTAIFNAVRQARRATAKQRSELFSVGEKVSFGTNKHPKFGTIKKLTSIGATVECEDGQERKLSFISLKKI